MYTTEENTASEGSFQSKPSEYTAVAKPFPKGICEPAYRKISEQAKEKLRGVERCPTVLISSSNQNFIAAKNKTHRKKTVGKSYLFH